MHYLEKLDAVANLEIVGMYHQLEDDPDGPTMVDVLHVFGRTRGTPHIYYYRRRVDSAYWTAWEKVDLDIEGDHLIPVVWNRRLHLFWPIFTEENVETNGSVTVSEGEPIPPPPKQWKIQLAWSERKQGKWTAKKISIGSARLLQSTVETKEWVLFRSQLDAQRNSLGIRAVWRSSRVYVRFSHFYFEGAGGDPLIFDDSTRVDVFNPIGTKTQQMMFAEDGHQRLILPTPPQRDALGTTPGTFRLLPPHEGSTLNTHPFFYSDNTRTFFVTPQVAPVLSDWHAPELINPGGIRLRPEIYYQKPKPVIPDRIGPVARPGDPVIFTPSFPRVKAVNPRLGVAGFNNTTTEFNGEIASGGERSLTVPSGDGSALTESGPRLMRAPGFEAADFEFSRVAGGIIAYPLIPIPITETYYRFQIFYHPY